MYKCLKNFNTNQFRKNKKEILSKRFIPLELKYKIISYLRLKEENYLKLFVDLRLM